MHAHHGDLGMHGITENHRRNAAPFSMHALRVCACACVRACVRARAFVCDYVEGHLCGELCDVTKYTMAINFINRQLYTVQRRAVGGAQLQEIMESSTHN